MRKQLIIFVAFFSSMFGFSQTVIEKSSIDSGGDNTTVGTTTLLYTIGKVVVQETSNGTIHISEGFISVGGFRRFRNRKLYRTSWSIHLSKSNDRLCEN